ncbi:MAG TPA: condensation domain-containing protein, partial [Longimicrobium sp.]|nr:condensation domain-containing protein [Longimicrobium sp.]
AQIRTVLPDGLVNMYGPTETTVWSATHPATESDGTVPIGRPIANTRVYVLDAAFRPQPVGVSGELFIAGAGVTRGYHNRPGLTADRFVPEPWGGDAGARMYRTGDRARWRADGTLEFLGRADFQVKIRGFRIEPGEIESALLAHEGVRECAVIARADGAGETRLVAYAAGDADADALRAHLRHTLPEHMVPGAFVRLDALPLTPSGKLDRAALPAPDLAAPEERYEAPRTPTEEVLARIWADVLHLERVGIRDNFFELGGHSLLATRVVVHIGAAFGVELPVRAFFAAPTVAGLAGEVEALRRAEPLRLAPLVPVDRSSPPPLSFAQERLWFLDRLQPGGAFYNLTIPLRLRGALDGAALERALGLVVRRHEALRTTLAEDDGTPVQVVAPFAGFALPLEEARGLEGEELEAEVRGLAAGEAARPFDLAAGPLFRARLVRLDAEDHLLLLTMHHVVSDGWSVDVLFGEMAAAYAAYRDGREPVLPELPVQYADHAVWQREQLRGERLDRQLAYWRERLAGAPELLELPTDHPRPAMMAFRGAYEPIRLSGPLLEGLEALARREGATLFMVLLGAFQALLARYAGTDDVVVGTTIAGRSRAEVEPLIGLFMNTLALRTDLSGDPAFREVLRRVRETTLGAYDHQEVPFERLVTELRTGRSLGHTPLFQALLELHNTAGPGGGLPGLEVRGVSADGGTAKFDLAVSLRPTSDGLAGGLTYATALFEPATARRMVRHLERVLEQVCTNPDLRLSEVELVDAEERRTVVEAWNRTDAAYPADRCIHQLFAEQAART